MSSTISSLPLPRVSIIIKKSEYSDKKPLQPQMTSASSFKKSRKSTTASAKTTVTFDTTTPTPSSNAKRSASQRKSAATTIKTGSSVKSSRKSLTASTSERNDYRTLSFETIASINWTNHCRIRREQIPLKLRSCFIISKLPLIKST